MAIYLSLGKYKILIFPQHWSKLFNIIWALMWDIPSDGLISCLSKNVKSQRKQKHADQTVQMHRLVCAFVFCFQQFYLGLHCLQMYPFLKVVSILQGEKNEIFIQITYIVYIYGSDKPAHTQSLGRGFVAHIPKVWRLRPKVKLNFFVPMEFPTKFDTVKSGWSIICIEGSQVIILNKYCISFSEDKFFLSKQCRSWWNATLCGISSGSSLFVEVLGPERISFFCIENL